MRKTKICPKCKTERSLDDFWRHKIGTKQGQPYSYCKACHSLMNISWRKQNQEKIKENGKKRYSKISGAIRIQTKKYYLERKIKEPWWAIWIGINNRCRSNHKRFYPYYKGKGIMNRMTLNEVKTIWFRDKAYLLKNPSIDRLDSNKDYTLENCRFIESQENSRRAGYQTNKNKLLAQPK